MPYSTSAVCDDYLAGAHCREVAERHGINRRTVEAVLKRQGIPRRRSQGRAARSFDGDVAREMYENGQTVAEVARHFGVADARIRGVLLDAGVLRLGGMRLAVQGRSISPNGYVRLTVDRDDPMQMAMVNSAFQILEHRLVMARTLGRPLRDDESVHHLNGDRSDNRIENLELRVRYHGQGQQVVCADCGSHNVVPRGENVAVLH